MKKGYFMIIYVSCSIFLFGQNSHDLGRFHIANTPKFLEDGLQNDFLFGFFYTDDMKIAGDVRIRYSNIAKDNVKLWNIDDSMLSRSQYECELFLLPLNYYFFKGAGFTIHTGAGLYYNYSKLHENGYFNDSSIIGALTENRYNAYTNDFIAHALGPLLDIGMSYKNGILYCAFSLGSVPFHYLNRKQDWKLSPLMNPVPSYSVRSESVFGPYFYANFDIVLEFKYASLFISALGEFSRLRYTAAGINGETGAWVDAETEVENKIFSFETSLLFHFGISDICMQFGYGRKFDEAAGGKNYLLLGLRKEWF